MYQNLKVRILLCGKKNIDVIEEIKKRGINVSPCSFSSALHGRLNTPAGRNILQAAEEVISGWEKEQGRIWRDRYDDLLRKEENA